MTKEEKIKESWGELFDTSISEEGFKNVENEEVFCVNTKYPRHEFEYRRETFDNINVRPKSLQGVEHNNGWFTLNNVAEEIPIELDSIELCNINTGEYYISTDTHEFIEIGRFSHWKPLEKSKYPLF